MAWTVRAGCIQQCMPYLTPCEAQTVACTAKHYLDLVGTYQQWPDWLQERFGYTVNQDYDGESRRHKLRNRKPKATQEVERSSPQLTNQIPEAYRLFCQLMRAHYGRELARRQKASILRRSRILRILLDALFFIILPLGFIASVWKAMHAVAVDAGGVMPYNSIVNPLLCAWLLLMACVAIHKCLDQWVAVPGELSILDHQSQGNELSIPWLICSLLENSVELEFSVDWTSKTVFCRRAYCPGAKMRWTAACVTAALILVQLLMFRNLAEQRNAVEALQYLTPFICLALATTILPMAVVPGEWRCYSFPRGEMYGEVSSLYFKGSQAMKIENNEKFCSVFWQ
jgi:hypothetical protein